MANQTNPVDHDQASRRFGIPGGQTAIGNIPLKGNQPI